MSQSKNRARVQKELAPVFRSQTRVLLTPGSGQVALTAEAISSAPVSLQVHLRLPLQGRAALEVQHAIAVDPRQERRPQDSF